MKTCQQFLAKEDRFTDRLRLPKFSSLARTLRGLLDPLIRLGENEAVLVVRSSVTNGFFRGYALRVDRKGGDE